MQILTRLASLPLLLALLASGADATDWTLDVQGPVPGGTLKIGVHDDYLQLEGCGSTCYAPPLCTVAVSCPPGSTPTEVAAAVVAAILADPGCQALGFTAAGSAGVPGRFVISGPTSADYHACIDWWPVGSISGCCGTIVQTACGTFICSEPATSYCTAGTSAGGCQASLQAVGKPSLVQASGFWLSAANVAGQRPGLFLFGSNGRQAHPFGGGSSASFLCVAPPVDCGGPLAGTGTEGLCDGALAQDLNALWAAQPEQRPHPGSRVQAQLWYRDLTSTSNRTTALSDAVEFLVGY